MVGSDMLKVGNMLVLSEDITPSYIEGSTEADTYEIKEIFAQSDGVILARLVKIE